MVNTEQRSHTGRQGDREFTARRCDYCGAEAPVVWVHGHGQCASCGINVEECCRGEQCGRDDYWSATE